MEISGKLLLVYFVLLASTACSSGGSGTDGGQKELSDATSDVAEGEDTAIGGEDAAAGDAETDSDTPPKGVIKISLNPFLGETDGCIFADDPLDAGPAPKASSLLMKSKTFVVKLWTHTPTSADDPPLFDSMEVHGCFQLSGSDIKVQDIEVNSTTFIFFESFSDDGCTESVIRAARGGVTVKANETTGPVGLYLCHTMNWPTE